jgi:hypothetical protein
MAAWLGVNVVVFDTGVLGSVSGDFGEQAFKPIRAVKAMEIFRVLNKEGSMEDIPRNKYF